MLKLHGDARSTNLTTNIFWVQILRVSFVILTRVTLIYDPAREPDSFACIYHAGPGIDWIDDIKVQVFCIKFLAELKAFRAEFIQP